MFTRYDISSTDDKLEALRRARVYAESRATVGQTVRTFGSELTHKRAHAHEKARFSLGNMVAVQGLEPRTQRI